MYILGSNKENSDQESEYLPSDDQDSSSNNESPQKHKTIVSANKSSNSSFDVSQIEGTSACNDENMFVETSEMKGTKRHYVIIV